MKLTLILISFCFALVSYAQKGFEQSKFKEIPNCDSMLFDIDIEFDKKYPYTLTKFNLKADSCALLPQEGKLPYCMYGMYKIQQDSTSIVYIVLITSEKLKRTSYIGRHLDAQISLLVYSKLDSMFKDTLVLAKKNLWIDYMNSGDMVYLTDYKSTVYFDENARLIKVGTQYKTDQIHSVYAIDIEKDYSSLVHEWKNGSLMKK